jgi:hypothetical protein
MIELIVDESYAFDYLSILQIKSEISNNTEKFDLIYQDLKSKLDIFDIIIKSKEYKDVYNANKKIFEAVDLAKENKVDAKYVDVCNYERYIVKVKLQNKFFGNDLIEKKIGYE